VLRVRVTAPPVEGAANVALIRVLASALDVAASDVRLVGGERARQKRVEVSGLAEERLRSRWPDLGV